VLRDASDGIYTLSLFPPPLAEVAGTSAGVVYTKPWVAELLLSLSGYDASADLASRRAVEPAAGDGAFALPMVERLLASSMRHGHPIQSCGEALLLYEVDAEAAARLRTAVIARLRGAEIHVEDARRLAASWVRCGDYLLDAPQLPGADLVVGNPPYIRLEDVSMERMAWYRNMYPTMRGRADLYIAFYEAALRQLNPGGLCTFICADRWMLNQYGADLRQLITSSYGVETVIEMHDAEPFADDVAAYPAVTVIRRSSQGGAVVAHLDAAAEHAGATTLSAALLQLRQGGAPPLPRGMRGARLDHWFSADDPWPCTSPERLALLTRLEAGFRPLEDAETGTRVGIGVATGADDVFITADPGIVEAERLLPLAMSRDTMAGEVIWSGRYLINPWDAHGLVSLDAYPRMAAYLSRHTGRLKARHVAKRGGQGWYRTIDRVAYGLLERSKLYIPDIKDSLHPVLDSGSTYPHHNLYYLVSDRWDLEVLGGLLMSAIGQFFLECYSVRMQNGYFRFQAQYLRRIRVPRPQEIPPEVAAALKEAFRRRDQAAATRAALLAYGVPAVPEEHTNGR